MKGCDIILHLELFQGWIGILWFYSVIPICHTSWCYFRDARMYKNKQVSCLRLCLCSFNSCPHLHTSPIRCYKTTQGSLSLCGNTYCVAVVWLNGEPRGIRGYAHCNLWPAPHLTVCLFVKSTAATAVQPPSVCSPFNACRQSTHTRCYSIPIQRHARMLCIPIHTLRNKSQSGRHTLHSR